MTDQTEWVALDVDGGGAPMRAHVTRPAGEGPHPGLLLFQEALGVGPQLRGVAARLAAHGLVVIAPELYHRTAPGFEHETLDMAVLMPLIRSMTTDGMVADARAAYGWLVSQQDVDAGRVAALLARTAQAASRGEFELFKTTSIYDGTAQHPEWLGEEPERWQATVPE